MKVDEPFNPERKSGEPPSGLKFRLAEDRDFTALANLMAERNPQSPRESIDLSMKRELDTMKSDMNYRLYVADLEGEIVGFCRFYDSAGLPQSKKVHPSPEGWYGMGILVKPEFRRQGIAKFLTAKRIEVLRSREVKEFYSIVDANNKTSKRMHESFGFEPVEKAKGFLHLTIEPNGAILYRLKL